MVSPLQGANNVPAGTAVEVELGLEDGLGLTVRVAVSDAEGVEVGDAEAV
jgi:hypothetical protein